MTGGRQAIAQMQVIVIVGLLVVAVVVAGFYFLGTAGPDSGSAPVNLSIVETDPVNQIDNLSPANVTVQHNTTVTLAVRNGDDAPRTIQINAFNVNTTIASGTAQRITFTVGGPGTFQIYVPPKPAANGLKQSSSISGYLIVQ